MYFTLRAPTHKLLLAFAVFGIASQSLGKSDDWSTRIISATHRPIVSLFFAHAGLVNVLTIDGKRFENARGIERFYLMVPGTDMIVFVVDAKDNRSLTYHVYNMDTREDIAIPAEASLFGRSLGAVDSSESAEKDPGGNIVLCYADRNAQSTLPSLAKLDSTKSYYYLDLFKRVVVSERTFYFDKNGIIIGDRTYNERPNQSTDPTLSSGTPAAEQPARHP